MSEHDHGPATIASTARDLLAALDERDREAAWLNRHRELEENRREALRYPLRDAAAFLLAHLDADVERQALILDPYTSIESLRDLLTIVGVLVRNTADEGAGRDVASEPLEELLLQLAGCGYTRG